MSNLSTCNCRSCGAPIFWVRMRASGKLNPLDAEPSEKGNVRIQDDEGFMVSKLERGNATVPLFLSHFATCPDGPSFRKKS